MMHIQCILNLIQTFELKFGCSFTSLIELCDEKTCFLDMQNKGANQLHGKYVLFSLQ